MKSFVVRSMTRILLGRNKRTLQPITRTLRRGSAQTLTGKPIRGRAAGAKVVSLALPKEGKRTLGAAQSGRRSGRIEPLHVPRCDAQAADRNAALREADRGLRGRTGSVSVAGISTLQNRTNAT